MPSRFKHWNSLKLFLRFVEELISSVDKVSTIMCFWDELLELHYIGFLMTLFLNQDWTEENIHYFSKGKLTAMVWQCRKDGEKRNTKQVFEMWVEGRFGCSMSHITWGDGTETWRNNGRNEEERQRDLTGRDGWNKATLTFEKGEEEK